MDAIAYPVGNSLYLNITNRCTNECGFCIRNKARRFEQKYSLWLEKEPEAEEIIKAAGDPSRYDQIVFCGYGEPLLRLETVKEVARALKKKKAVIRIDTNGHANLFWGRDILPELKGLVDSISISLNAQSAEVYDRICRSIYGREAYPAVIDFIKRAKKYIPRVEATIVDLPAVNKDECEKIADELGVSFRVRPYYEDKYVR